MKKDMVKIAEQYREKGYVRGYELLLFHQDALSLIDIFEQENILVLGCNLWQFWNEERTAFMEIVGGGGIIEKDLSRTDPVYNARILKAFLQNPLPFEADLISFDFANPEVWDWLVPPKLQYPHGKRTYPPEEAVKKVNNSLKGG